MTANNDLVQPINNELMIQLYTEDNIAITVAKIKYYSERSADMTGFYTTLRERIHFKLFECGQAVQAGMIRALATATITNSEMLKVSDYWWLITNLIKRVC